MLGHDRPSTHVHRCIGLGDDISAKAAYMFLLEKNNGMHQQYARSRASRAIGQEYDCGWKRVMSSIWFAK